MYEVFFHVLLNMLGEAEYLTNEVKLGRTCLHVVGRDNLENNLPVSQEIEHIIPTVILLLSFYPRGKK